MDYIEINENAYARQADALLQEGKAEEAVRLIEQNISDDEFSPESWIVYARCLYTAGELQRARQALMDVIADDPECPAALELLVKISEDNNDIGAAEYYRTRLTESMQFTVDADRFWKADYPVEDLTDADESAHPKPVDRESLITSIKGMLGKEAERIWPFETQTLAELFIKQGHVRKGLAVYSRLLRNDTGNDEIIRRVAGLLDTEAHLENRLENIDEGTERVEKENKGIDEQQT